MTTTSKKKPPLGKGRFPESGPGLVRKRCENIDCRRIFYTRSMNPYKTCCTICSEKRTAIVRRQNSRRFYHTKKTYKLVTLEIDPAKIKLIEECGARIVGLRATIEFDEESYAMLEKKARRRSMKEFLGPKKSE